MATYYRAKYYIDNLAYCIVKDGLYTIKELQRLGYLSTPTHPTVHSSPPINMFDEVKINSKDCYYFFGIRFCDKLEEYLK